MDEDLIIVQGQWRRLGKKNCGEAVGAKRRLNSRETRHGTKGCRRAGGESEEVVERETRNEAMRSGGNENA